MTKKKVVNPELTKKHQASRRRILTDKEIKEYSEHMRKAMGLTITISKMSEEYGISIEDSLRFQSLAARVEEARTAKGLSLKEAAASLKVAKYRLGYIEESSIKNISPDILVRYIEYLGLIRWFSRWKKANAELAVNMGLS